MLIPVWFYKGLLYGPLACAVLSLLWYAYRPEKKADALPRAEIAGSRNWRFLSWLPPVALFGGPLLAWCVHRYAVDVIHVDDAHDGPVAWRMKSLGEPSYTPAPNEPADDGWSDDTWVLNDSSRTLRIETKHYGRSFLGLGGPSDAASIPTIPPNTGRRSSSIDHLGPADPPPEAVMVEGFQAKVGQASRTWLTWDR